MWASCLLEATEEFIVDFIIFSKYSSNYFSPDIFIV